MYYSNLKRANTRAANRLLINSDANQKPKEAGKIVLKPLLSVALIYVLSTMPWVEATSAATLFTGNSWQTSESETLELPNLRGSGLSFDEQYQNKMLAAQFP